MIKAKLFRQLYSTKEFKTITVSSISEIHDYCINGWKCINYTVCGY